MERRFRIRLEELRSDAEVRPCLLKGVLARLESFLQPFVTALQTPEQASMWRGRRCRRSIQRAALARPLVRLLSSAFVVGSPTDVFPRQRS